MIRTNFAIFAMTALIATTLASRGKKAAVESAPEVKANADVVRPNWTSGP